MLIVPSEFSLTEYGVFSSSSFVVTCEASAAFKFENKTVFSDLPEYKNPAPIAITHAAAPPIIITFAFVFNFLNLRTKSFSTPFCSSTDIHLFAFWF